MLKLRMNESASKSKIQRPGSYAPGEPRFDANRSMYRRKQDTARRVHGAVSFLQNFSRHRTQKIQSWISKQREFLSTEKYSKIKRVLTNWSGQSTDKTSKELLAVLNEAPPTNRHTPGYVYRKLILTPDRNIKLNFQRATSWSLNPLFAASFKARQQMMTHILLKLPLSTPASKLYIGDTSRLLNSGRRTIHRAFPEEAEVIVAPLNLEIVKTYVVPLRTITGVDLTTGKSRKMSRTGNSRGINRGGMYTRFYTDDNSSNRNPNTHLQHVPITVVEVKERSKNESLLWKSKNEAKKNLVGNFQQYWLTDGVTR